MIIDIRENAERYCGLHPGFAEAFTFLRALREGTLSPGRHEIDGERVYAVCADAEGRGRRQALLETHRRCIDIHYTLRGEDEIGWRPLNECRADAGDYDPAKDIAFWKDAPRCYFPAPAGTFTVAFPRDAHAPLAREGRILKVVIKIACGGPLP